VNDFFGEALASFACTSHSDRKTINIIYLFVSEQYIARFPAGASQVGWWIMENRREYFDRAKVVLNRVKMLIFLSESQSRQWLNWCEEENIKLRSQPALVPLAVNDELAFVAGISCSLNTPSFSTEKMREKKQLLRDSIRKEMGLMDNDMLLLSLSSINPGKGQFFLLESARLMIEQKPLDNNSKIKNPVNIAQNQSNMAKKHHLRALFQNLNNVGISSNELPASNESFIGLKLSKRKALRLRSPSNDTDAVSFYVSQGMRKMLSDIGGTQEQTLKILIGSVGSKSNKVPYVKGLLRFLSQHSNLSKSVLWTPATTRVASLYSAADVYVINSQVIHLHGLLVIQVNRKVLLAVDIFKESFIFVPVLMSQLMLLSLHQNINSWIDPLLMKNRWILLKDLFALFSRRVLAKL
jgi:hypothetical protein